VPHISSDAADEMGLNFFTIVPQSGRPFTLQRPFFDAKFLSVSYRCIARRSSDEYR
jgi:hypothetical protein